HVAKAYLIGEAAAEFAATLGDAVPYEISDTLERAVAHAAADSERDESAASAVMLSPADEGFAPDFEILILVEACASRG
ncbi:hypothetical protein ACC708_37190, partial [Rhizobium ruizarguesonis]